MAKAAPCAMELEAGCDQSNVDGFSSSASDIIREISQAQVISVV